MVAAPARPGRAAAAPAAHTARTAAPILRQAASKGGGGWSRCVGLRSTGEAENNAALLRDGHGVRQRAVGHLSAKRRFEGGGGSKGGVRWGSKRRNQASLRTFDAASHRDDAELLHIASTV